jgi:hypothetical protein
MMKLTDAERALLDACCCLCLEDTSLTTGDYRWCASHAFRGELIAWGMAHGYPELDGGFYGIARGEYFWVVATTQGSDEMVQDLLIMTKVSEVA